MSAGAWSRSSGTCPDGRLVAPRAAAILLAVPEPHDQIVDATRRTRLAAERTYLAWWRTGLTAFAVSLAAGKLVPEVSGDAADVPYLVLGAAFALVGVACILYGWRRQRSVELGLDRGEYSSPDHRVVAVVSAGGAGLGVALTVLLLAGV